MAARCWPVHSPATWVIPKMRPMRPKSRARSIHQIFWYRVSRALASPQIFLIWVVVWSRGFLISMKGFPWSPAEPLENHKPALEKGGREKFRLSTFVRGVNLRGWPYFLRRVNRDESKGDVPLVPGVGGH